MLLLVDDRDGRIVAELRTQEDIERVLRAWTQDDAPLPEYLCIVEAQSRPGVIVGVDSSVKARPLA